LKEKELMKRDPFSFDPTRDSIMDLNTIQIEVKEEGNKEEESNGKKEKKGISKYNFNNIEK
jgi:hypothetical protein